MIAGGGGAEVSLPETGAISVITLGELRAGVALARDPMVAELRRRRLAAVRMAFAPLPVDLAVAERYGDVLASARSRGRITKATDLLIVATALATSRRLHTRDLAQARLAEEVGLAVSLA